MKVKFKKLHPDAVIPTYSKEGDAGLDFTALKIINYIDSLTGEISQIEVKSGIALEIPEGYVGLIFPRSSIKNTGLRQANSVGVVDSGYRGEINFFFDIQDPNLKFYEKGDRVGQMIIIPYPKIELQEVEELSDSERGEEGWGSTGK